MPDAFQKNRDDWRMPDAVWERIVPRLPPRTPHPLGGHRRRGDDRQAMEALFFVRRTGCQGHAWDATGICSHSAAHRRFQEGGGADVLVALWAQGLVDSEALQGMDGEGLAMDGAMTTAPLGGDKGGHEPDRPRHERHAVQRAHRRRWGAHRPRGGERASQ